LNLLCFLLKILVKTRQIGIRTMAAQVTTHYKIVNANMKNRDYVYKEGLNVYPSPYLNSGLLGCFGYDPYMLACGLFFTTMENIPYWAARLESKPDCLIFKVEIPDYAVVVPPLTVNIGEWKTDAIILSDPMPILEFLALHGMEQQMVRLVPRWIEYVNQTHEICLEAVKRNMGLMRYIREHTEALCIEAVTVNCMTLGIIKEQTHATCMAALRAHWDALAYIKVKTPELCLAAVNYHGESILLVREQTKEVCLAAVRQDIKALKHIKKQTTEICMAAVRHNGLALEFVAEWLKTEEICLAAMANDPDALQFITHQTVEMCLFAVLQKGSALKHVAFNPDAKPISRREFLYKCLLAVEKEFKASANPRENLVCFAAIANAPDASQFIDEVTIGMCRLTIAEKGEISKYVLPDIKPITRREYYDICLLAIEQDYMAIKHAKHLTPEFFLEWHEKSKAKAKAKAEALPPPE
jgi:Domain of unknown function (DUF4116)